MTTTTALRTNPYEEAYRESLREELGRYGHRSKLVYEYAWGIPDDRALTEIAKLGPIVEIGAGNGYWAHLLRERGVDVVAYDTNPPGCGRDDWYGKQEAWTEVEEGGPEAAALHPDRALFLCWPPYGRSMAADCLDHYTGDTLIYVGEPPEGCNADRKFFRMVGEADACHPCRSGLPDDCWHEGPCGEVSAVWERSRAVPVPQWPGIHDELVIYRRKS